MFLQNSNEKENSMYPTLFENKEDCCGCFACAAICPVNAVVMITDEEGFNYPLINRDICIKCYRCMKVCPIKDN